ncbi:MAG: hypothetical protein NTZ17_00085 [Phycisphaerae bacterium]|nr:hypothetical protein [Phycisphaerae bacterium]
MASEAQVAANRLNAQKSTGPRTPEGKTVVSQNAVKHGLLAREVVIKGEDPGQFEFYRDQMLGELAPAGQMESVLAERVVSLSWRLQRAERLQTAAFDAMYREDTAGSGAWTKRMLRAKAEPGDGDLILGQMVVADFGHAKVLDRLLMYERRIEHSLYRTMGELQKQRLMRELDPPAAEPTVEAGSVARSVPIRASKTCVAGFQPATDAAKMAATQAPCRVTTNVAEDEEQACETNPICVSPIERQVPCGTGVRNDSAHDEPGENKPNFRRRGTRRPRPTTRCLPNGDWRFAVYNSGTGIYHSASVAEQPRPVMNRQSQIRRIGSC